MPQNSAKLWESSSYAQTTKHTSVAARARTLEQHPLYLFFCFIYSHEERPLLITASLARSQD